MRVFATHGVELLAEGDGFEAFETKIGGKVSA
jgi:hypothetical protein